MGCFSSNQPTYTPPTPPTLQTGSQLYDSANNWWNANHPDLYNAQSNALKNANDPNYWNSFQPSSFEQALGNQYFKNVWPDTQAYMKDQLSKSGFINSPGASQALGNSMGNIETGIGQYLSGIGQQQAMTGINAGLGISLQGLLNPFVGTDQSQSNSQANLNYSYQQALAQQQYQQEMNKYQQQAAMANTFGQFSPIGGGIYGASTGHFGDALSGSAQTMQSMMPMMMSGASGGAGMGMGQYMMSPFSGMFGGGQGQGQSYDGWNLNGNGGPSGYGSYFASAPYSGGTSKV